MIRRLPSHPREAEAEVAVPLPVALKVRTTAVPTSASPTWRMTRESKVRAIRHTRPAVR